MKRGVFMEPVKLLALDLDGTLLNAQKELTPRTRDALYAAAEAGVEVVPTTGRFFTGIPEVIQKLPFLHYAITINGAQVYDIRENKAVSTAEIPLETALRVLDYLDGFPVIYDCYHGINSLFKEYPWYWGFHPGALRPGPRPFSASGPCP